MNTTKPWPLVINLEVDEDMVMQIIDSLFSVSNPKTDVLGGLHFEYKYLLDLRDCYRAELGNRRPESTGEDELREPKTRLLNYLEINEEAFLIFENQSIITGILKETRMAIDLLKMEYFELRAVYSC